MPAWSYALPTARPLSAEFHINVTHPLRSVRLTPVPAEENLTSVSPVGNVGTGQPFLGANLSTTSGASPGNVTGPPQPWNAGTAHATISPSATTIPPSVTTTPPSAAVVSGSPAPPSSREIILPGRKSSPDEERQRQQEREQFAQILSALRAAVAEVRRQQQQRLHEWQRAAIELAMTIASRLLYERIQSGEFPIDARVREMVAQLENEPVLAIRLHPQDLKLLQQRLGDQPLLPEGEQPRFIADASLARGECRVEGRETILLSDIVRQLEEIRDELFRSLGHARS